MLPNPYEVGIDPMSRQPRQVGMKSARLLCEITDFAARALEQSGIPAPDSRRLAINVTTALSENLGGVTLYLPRGQAAKIAARDQLIYAAYDGKPETVTALARQHGLSEIATYRILDRQRQLRRAAA